MNCPSVPWAASIVIIIVIIFALNVREWPEFELEFELECFQDSHVEMRTRRHLVLSFAKIRSMSSCPPFFHRYCRSPKHPALFVTANISGELGLWNLNHSMEEPFAPPVKVTPYLRRALLSHESIGDSFFSFFLTRFGLVLGYFPFETFPLQQAQASLTLTPSVVSPSQRVIHQAGCGSMCVDSHGVVAGRAKAVCWRRQGV